jgi:hypothetical protein
MLGTLKFFCYSSDNRGIKKSIPGTFGMLLSPKSLTTNFYPLLAYVLALRLRTIFLL